MLENRISIIVVKCISIDSKSILSLIIVLSVYIIKTWFYKIIGYKLVIISLSSYINKGICLT
jgi:hypothetical protein